MEVKGLLKYISKMEKENKDLLFDFKILKERFPDLPIYRKKDSTIKDGKSTFNKLKTRIKVMSMMK